MTPSTLKVIKYILIFFSLIIFVIVLFYIYNTFFVKNNFNLDFLKNSEFVSVTDRENNDKNNKVEYANITYSSCDFNGEKVDHKKAKTFYSRSSVGPYESCDDFSKTKRCNDGKWLGNPKFKFNSCKRTVDCKIGKNNILKNGESIDLYSRESVQYGDDCENYKRSRTCRDSSLRGSAIYKYLNCKTSTTGVCNVYGIKLGNGQSRQFFLKSNVEYTESCSDYMQNRVCAFGVLQGEKKFSYLTCTKKQPRNCYSDGITIPHGAEVGTTLYSRKKSDGVHSCQFFSLERKCTDGVLDGQDEYKYANCIE